jgi:tetratricopeptide (TPR) repeat protein
VASVQQAPAAANNASGGGSASGAVTGGAVEQEANLGPPPALDLGAIQSGPDLSSTSLAGEFKQANTPARAAALRVTEQARVELAAGKIDDALRDLGRAVSIDPGNSFEYFYLGRTYIARGNYAQALTFFKRAEIGFATRPDWLGETVGFEGACDEELGRTTDGALAYRRALGSAPNNLRARVGYSRLSGYLPSTAAADESAAAGPARDALPPPERVAAQPAPHEAPPPPPPALVRPDGGAQNVPAGDYQPD